MTAAQHRKHEKTLEKLALEYPGAYVEFPWGEKVVKVKGKIFIFLSVEAYGDKIPVGLRCTVKLPLSRHDALDCPFAKPTGYNLGKSGWVTAAFKATQSVPLDLLIDWMDESYRAVAPKKLIKELDGHAPASAPAPKAPAKKPKKRLSSPRKGAK